jgi:polyhydroxyalkanoate synthesis regulator phasin
MRKLNKTQIEEKQRLLDALTEVKQKADEAIDNLNIAREEAKDFVSDLLTEMETYRDGKSEKWEESDNGAAYMAWCDAWDEIASQLDEDVPALDDIQTAIEAFNGAAEAPEG